MQKSKASCFHKIKQFQFHKGCHEYAGICIAECQKLHGDVLVTSVDAVEDHFKGIRQSIIQEIKKYSDKIKNLYGDMIDELMKQQTENMKQMEKELLTELVKNLDLQKSVVEKI